MFKSDWLILRVKHQAFEIKWSKGHYSEVVVHLYLLADNSHEISNIIW